MSCGLSYSSLVNNHLYREQESRAVQRRKRNILYMIENYLQSENLTHTLNSFRQEAQLLSDQYTLCDNIDLACIVQEYEDYYFLRFNKHPKFVKKLDTLVLAEVNRKPPRDLKRTMARVKSAPAHKQDKPQQEEINFDNIVITPMIKPPPQCSPSPLQKIDTLLEEFPDEWKPFVDIISQDIVTRDVNTRWSDVIGLEIAKKLLFEAIVYPIQYPELFQGLLSPWKGILLHGPPGTGKTLLAKAVATECNTTLFNISASSLISKWRGESEKLVRVLFSLARHHAPSTIFLDELDALMSRRDSEDHEASRRLKSELLVQLDGLHSSDDRVFLLATTNVPWDLDTAMLRRFEKRILVDIPDANARSAMLRYYLPPVVMTSPYLCSDLDYAVLASATENYSGSDIKTVCKEVAMQRVRETFDTLERFTQVHATPPRSKMNTTGNGMAQMKTPIKLKTITTQQVLTTLQRTKPSANYKTYYEKWQADYGAI